MRPSLSLIHRPQPPYPGVCFHVLPRDVQDLPDVFAAAVNRDMAAVDLVIVIGSSLRVRPVSRIVRHFRHVPQILINNEVVGGDDEVRACAVLCVCARARARSHTFLRRNLFENDRRKSRAALRSQLGTNSLFVCCSLQSRQQHKRAHTKKHPL